MSARVLLLCLIACTTEPSKAPDKAPETTPDGPADDGRSYNIDIPTTTYSWDPQAGDKSVSAELGGPGFTGEGWDTRMEFLAFGDKDAPQGGSMSLALTDWPATLRMAGKDWNVQFNYFTKEALYMSLLELDTELEYIPSLATHWQVSEDRSTYRFRINPEARWSDGKEVTSADVIATWKLRTDPTILEPSGNVMYGKFEEPVAISRYIVEVKVKEESWLNLMVFSVALKILPAHQISISGSEYLDKYQFDYTATTGPYMVPEDKIETGTTITLVRRDDWWAEDNPAYDGRYNIGQYKFMVIKDPSLRFEKNKKGELDYFRINKAQWWAEEVPKLEAVQRGLLVPRKFYNDAPAGFAGLAINMKREPLNDVRVRKALQLLKDRKTLIEKLYFNEYEPLDTYFPGPNANPGNELLEYDPFAAVELLEEAGWTEIGDNGFRVKDGVELKIGLQYRSQLSERGLTVYQEACKQAGINLDLQLLTPAAAWKNVREKEYELSSMAWGAIVFPNPEGMWHSRFADQKDNNNIAAFANAEVDALIDQYNREYDAAARTRIMHRIDEIVYNQHPYVLEHYLPPQRVVFWNKFGMPEWGVPRFLDDSEMFQVWWVDPEKEKALEAAKADSTQTMDASPMHHRFWEQWNAAQTRKPGMKAAMKAGFPGAKGKAKAGKAGQKAGGAASAPAPKAKAAPAGAAKAIKAKGKDGKEGKAGKAKGN